MLIPMRLNLVPETKDFLAKLAKCSEKAGWVQ
jgi:hypothetical protein